ncbi:carboxypeptidase-like regulatory domain-containing protein [Bacteroides fragilis]|uniref:M56 family metallopeptidase n=1 Tax=Bacteroides fragilis TaxID=817 RepID=UPI0020308AD6|nr:M56 family metallopeptidase [Bacteroides fragilis]MCM0271242.1 carboxypeptidase-like regulatory domain-containing protein [Bacteroides fragilis]MCZ2618167.1 carboxypeptidase-like regulatory domain-containing protein [Bacteroides fragilis]MCZ2626512.1 carboxypeptidase-like regulatory domain-containing protein [Bacteroides fragilis]
MGVFFVYILKSSACLAGFYLFYRLLLSKETFHRFNRIALLALLLLSLLLPLIQLTTTQQTEMHQTMLTIEQLLMMADMPASEVTQAEGASVSGIQIILIIYLSGILFFVCRHLYSLIRLLALLRSGKKERMGNGITLVVHQCKISPFSWMKYIVISKKDLEEDGREILIHETAHICNRHSVDLLIADICIFFQWFNPASWLLKQELQNIHEYEADETVIREGVNAKQYQLLLIKKAVGTRLYSMANSFNHSKLKKRITMMLKEKSNPWARLKYLYVLPLAAIAVTAFARPEISGKMEEISAVKVNDLKQIVEKKVPEKTIEVAVDTVKKNALEKVVIEVSQLDTVSISSKVTISDGLKRNGLSPFATRRVDFQPQPLIMVDGKEITGEQMEAINPDMIESISVLKDKESVRIYGDKAEHGVILITLKGENANDLNKLSFSTMNSDELVKVTGTVKDHLNNPIVGASVSISGTTLGTVSDAYGHFVISAPRSAMLHISCLGMKPVRTAVSSEVNVILNPED